MNHKYWQFSDYLQFTSFHDFSNRFNKYGFSADHKTSYIAGFGRDILYCTIGEPGNENGIILMATVPMLCIACPVIIPTAFCLLAADLVSIPSIIAIHKFSELTGLCGGCNDAHRHQ